MENHFNCIYCYTNKVNGKKYVGQAKDFIKRHNSHIRQAYNEKRKCDYNVPFHNAIRRHGIENFEIEILKENLPTKEDLNYWECYYIVELDTLVKNGKGYNLASGGDGGNTYAGKTDEELAEIRKKLSEANKGKNNPMYGKNPLAGKSDEELAERSRKISEAHKGKNNGCIGEKHPRARKIVLVDTFTKLPVFIWQYKQQATKFYNIKHTTLDYYLKGKSKTGNLYNGFLWYYLDEYEQLTK